MFSVVFPMAERNKCSVAVDLIYKGPHYWKVK